MEFPQHRHSNHSWDWISGSTCLIGSRTRSAHLIPHSLHNIQVIAFTTRQVGLLTFSSPVWLQKSSGIQDVRGFLQDLGTRPRLVHFIQDIQQPLQCGTAGRISRPALLIQLAVLQQQRAVAGLWQLRAHVSCNGAPDDDLGGHVGVGKFPHIKTPHHNSKRINVR